MNSLDEIIFRLSSLTKNEVFYVPSVGPVFSKNNPEVNFRDAFISSETDRLLDYDKEIRWGAGKIESILTSKIILTNNNIFVPTFNKRNNLLSVFEFGDPTDLHKKNKYLKIISDSVSEGIRPSKVKYLWFDNNCTETETNHVIFKKDIHYQQSTLKNEKNIHLLSSLNDEVRETIKQFKKQDDLGGVVFLYDYYKSLKEDLPPIVCFVEGDSIIGAIGPIIHLIDPFGVKFIPPPYFGVLNEHRKKGVGRNIWMEAMKISYSTGGKYMLLQTEEMSPAYSFYRDQGCEYISTIHSFRVNA